ncbi:MAG TPA: hypothetical protein VFU05_02895 [Cyclobacteriaceae bacterium]|nr:hypothetical protein [Cyclobacteriaceae bacterium]
MKEEKKTTGNSFKRAIVRLHLFVLLMLIGISCEEGFLQSEDDALSSSELTNAELNSSMLDASLPHTNITELDMPVSVAYELTTYDCSNNPGPQITFSGLATTAGFGVRTIFRNNMKGTHEHSEEAYVDVSLQPDGTEIVIPKQPVLGGTGGNPFIWIQFIDDQGNAVGGEVFIGRCVQGYTFKGASQVNENAVASSKYTTEGCENSPGPNITFDAGLSMNGLSAVIIFRNNDNPVGGPHEATADLSNELEIIPAGTSWTFPKQPVLGGVGGNPWIFTQFLDGSANAMSNEILLGRCEQLSKAIE